MATINDTLATRKTETANQINNLYNQQYNANAANLKAAYDQNVANAQAEQAKIAPQYQTQANQLATQYERNRRNANMNAMASGMGTGTALQQQLAMNQQFQNNHANLRGNELQAQAQAGQNIANLGTDYQAKLAAARAEAENKKASAQIDNTNTMNNWYDAQAKLMAGYGDFSAYERLYGADAVKQMREVWAIQNPEVALGAGLIDRAKYKQITGHDPA